MRRLFSTLHRRISTPPVELLGEAVHAYSAIYYANLLGLICHFGFMLLFLALGQQELAAFNMGSVLWFTAVLFVVMPRARIDLALVMASFEVVAHAWFATTLLGWGSGFHYYVIVLIPMWFMLTSVSVLLRMALAMLPTSLYALLYVMHHETVSADLGEQALLALELMNIGAFTVVLAGLTYYFVWSGSVARAALAEEQHRLLELSEFLKRTFGRFHSDKVVDALLENPEAIGASARQPVTIMMTDLRGFTALCEQREPEEVVQMLNVYLESMVNVISEYGGTVHEIIGDALLVSFGAPRPMQDRVEQAVACAVRMQNEMPRINDVLGQRGLPALHMGIGVHDAEVVVGIVGSEKRAKYGIVGSGVNTAARIESYTTGGQILVSQAVVDAVGAQLRIDGQQEMRPKGVQTPLVVYDVGGIAGRHQLFRVLQDEPLVPLEVTIPCDATIVRGKVAEATSHRVFITHLSPSQARLQANPALTADLTIKLNLAEVPVRLKHCVVYAKVQAADGQGPRLVFTSVAPEIEAYVIARLQTASAPGHPRTAAS